MDFRDPNTIGMFPYHCHLLEHEDKGMMGTIRVVPAAAKVIPTADAERDGNPVKKSPEEKNLQAIIPQSIAPHFDATAEAFLFIHRSTGKYLFEIAAHLCS
jgi:hypothetical protein